MGPFVIKLLQEGVETGVPANRGSESSRQDCGPGTA
jgi:hypothetical protein